MRRTLLLLGLLTLVASGGVSASASVPHQAPAHAATVSVVVEPVTSTGHASSGFTVTKEHDAIDCSGDSPSLGAVANNIDECSPSAAYAIACWKSSKAGHTLCTRDPSSHKLYQFKLMSGFGTSTALKPKQRTPLLFTLAGGGTCSIRIGGTGGTLTQHPAWYATYYCSKHGAVWASTHNKHYGINKSGSSWTVQTSPGSKPLKTRHIVTAYYVGTAS